MIEYVSYIAEDHLPLYKSYFNFLAPIELCEISHIGEDNSRLDLKNEVLEWCHEHISFDIEYFEIQKEMMEAKCWNGQHHEVRFNVFVNFPKITFTKESDFIAFKLRWL